jgi:hypothetical protein
MAEESGNRTVICDFPPHNTCNCLPSSGWWLRMTVTRSGVFRRSYLVCDSVPVGQDSAFGVGAKLAFDEVRHRMIAVAGASEKRLEVLAHRLVKQRLFRATWDVRGRGSTTVRGLAIACGRCLRHHAGAMRSPCQWRSGPAGPPALTWPLVVLIGSRATGVREFTRLCPNQLSSPVPPPEMAVSGSGMRLADGGLLVSPRMHPVLLGLLKPCARGAGRRSPVLNPPRSRTRERHHNAALRETPPQE